jgi:cytosine/adenosine deaminase-related metal-dependent hydrolase
MTPLSALLFLSLASPNVSTGGTTTVIEHVTLIDVERGRTIGPRSVLIADGVITAIERSARTNVPPHARRIDGRGRYLMPGLVDMHVHLFNNASQRPPNTWAFPLFIANGVTGVREMRATAEQMAQVDAWRGAVTAGELEAPRILATGIAVRQIESPDAREQVRAAAAAGADFIKMFSTISSRTWETAIAEARAVGMPVDGHVPITVTPVQAARAGQRTGEHLTEVYEACTERSAAWGAARVGVDGTALESLRHSQDQPVLDAFDARVCTRVARALARTAFAEVPTLVLPSVETRFGIDDPTRDARWSRLREDERQRWLGILESVGRPEPKLAQRRLDVSLQIVEILHRAGVTILAGTDAPMVFVYPGSSLHDELRLFVTAGFSTADALRSATLWPARVLGIDDVAGTIAVGKRADLVLLDADPLVDIDNARRVHATIVAGHLWTRGQD